VWLRGEVKVKLYIYPSQGNTYHLAYQVKLPAGAPLGDWEFLIDAHTGEILQQNDLLMHVNGDASVYEENPITTRNTVDKALSNLDGSGFLRGDFVNILIYSGPSGVPINSRDFNNSLSNNASSRQHDFRYNPANDTRFDEANVYFHINRIQDYFKDTFDFIKLDEPLPVIVDHPAIDDRNNRILNRPMTSVSPMTWPRSFSEKLSRSCSPVSSGRVTPPMTGWLIIRSSPTCSIAAVMTVALAMLVFSGSSFSLTRASCTAARANSASWRGSSPARAREIFDIQRPTSY
ncbi:MAG: PepSY domain-containing protein, partial [Acidobacteria bacterium]|nr:PepSY domain-containing protein [Acidobacteriota bacterium]